MSGGLLEGLFGLGPTSADSLGVPSFLALLPLGGGYSIGPTSPIIITDDGGEFFTVAGPFVAGVPCAVAINGVPCPAGVPGLGYAPVATGSGVTAVTPADLQAWQVIGPDTFPYGGPYNLTVTQGATTITLANSVIVVRRDRFNEVYELAKRFPQGAYPARGDTEVDAGALLTPRAQIPARTLQMPAFVSAVGQTINEQQGVIFSRLVAPLPPAQLGTSPGPDSFVARMETTFAFPASGGVVVIAGETIAYAAADYTTATLTGLVRDDAVSVTYPAGTAVALYTGDVSNFERARSCLIVTTAEGRYLDNIGGNYGVPRWLDVPDVIYRRLIRTLAYQPGRGSRTALGQTLDALLIGKGYLGTDGVVTAPGGFSSAAGGFTPGMAGLRIRLNGDDSKVYRIAEVTDANTLVLDPQGSSLEWVAADLLSDTGVPFEVLPWDILPSPYRPGIAIIRINCAPATSPLGFAYWNGGETATSTTTTTVDTAYDIRQVVGVWLAADTMRTGTNYSTTNNFSGVTITLDTPLPGATTQVIIDYGSVTTPTGVVASGLPGSAEGAGTAQLLQDANWRNPAEPAEVAAQGYGQPAPITRYPLYLGDRIAYLYPILDLQTVAGVRPELEFYQW